MTKTSNLKTVSIIIPCYNEEENIRNLHSVLDAYMRQIDGWKPQYIYVSDGSRDKTWELISQLAQENSNVTGLNLSRNFGKEAALLAGIETANKSDGYLTLDADLQDDPAIIKEMLQRIDEGYDIAYGQRKDRKDSFVYQTFTKVFYYLMGQATRGSIPKNVADFYIFNERVRLEFLKLQESVRYTRGLLFYTGFKTVPVMYNREKRFAGTTKWNYLKLFNFSIDALTGFSTFPLHIISLIGILGCALSLFGTVGYVTYSLIFVKNTLNGWASIILLVSFFGSLQILMLGIISEYIARNTIETKNRPKYIVMDKLN
jgi:glycosyltransferase involved in cell wall biosynthesis